MPTVSLDLGEPERGVDLANGAEWGGPEVPRFLPDELKPRPWHYEPGTGTLIPAFIEQRSAIAHDDPGRKAARAAFEDRARAKLRAYIDSWLDAERSWDKWAARNAPILEAVNRMLARSQYFLGCGLVKKEALCARCRRPFGPKRPKADVGGGLACEPCVRQYYARWSAARLEGELRGLKRDQRPVPSVLSRRSLEYACEEERIEAFAAWFLLGILLTPCRDLVGKCQRPACGQYFLSNHRRFDGFAKRRFCSRSCRGERNTRARRAALRAEKIAEAARVLAQMPTGISDRAAYVVQQMPKHLGTTKNFVTRAMNRGDLPRRAFRHGGSHAKK